MKRLLFTFAIACALIPLNAQETLTLSQCLRMGIENNLQLQTRRNDIAKGGHAITENRAKLLPQINAVVSMTPESVGVLHVVATLPAYHGRGFARQLLQGGMEIARADGLSVLRLDTFPYNVRGRGLYESCGFADKGEWTVYYPALGDIQVIMYELAL